MQDFTNTFENMGAAGVRLSLENNQLNANIASQAIKWLTKKDQDLEKDAALNAAKHLEIASSASEAAWAAVAEASRANDRAQTANVIATMAMIAAIVTIAISIITAFIK